LARPVSFFHCPLRSPLQGDGPVAMRAGCPMVLPARSRSCVMMRFLNSMIDKYIAMLHIKFKRNKFRFLILCSLSCR
jgi:hypothetical protein